MTRSDENDGDGHVMPIQVDHLFRHPEHIGLVAGWIYTAFWADKPGYSEATFDALLRQASDPDAIPLSLLARVDEEPAGTINLIANDDERRPHLYPWLAALFVAQHYRRQGVGRALIAALMDEAGRLGFSEMYLGTDQPDYYARVGAQFHEQATDTLCIMRLPISETQTEGTGIARIKTL